MYLKNFKPLSKKGILFGIVSLVSASFLMNAIIPESKKVNHKTCIDFLQFNNLHGTCTAGYPERRLNIPVGTIPNIDPTNYEDYYDQYSYNGKSNY